MLQLTGLDQILHAYRTVEECFELAISVASVRCLISSVVATASPQKLFPVWVAEPQELRFNRHFELTVTASVV